MTPLPAFTADQRVRHPQHGEGRVVADLASPSSSGSAWRLSRWKPLNCRACAPSTTRSEDRRLDDALAALTRAQALAIHSVNAQWGVFSRSRVQLLPHQLWVCRQVTRTWPTRWLVADDVGLGKTIEAGLIMEPLLSSGRVRRVLVLAPARLVGQWRARLKTMFDIRLQEYAADLDRGRVNFWETSQQVVASFHTLRMKGARERLLTADAWDTDHRRRGAPFSGPRANYNAGLFVCSRRLRTPARSNRLCCSRAHRIAAMTTASWP